MKYVPFLILSIIYVVGCVSAKGKFSGTDIVTAYGTANSVNAEVEVNAYK